MNGKTLPCFVPIELFIISLIRSLLVTSWFMAALLLCLCRKHYTDELTGERSYVQRHYGYITVLCHWKENMLQLQCLWSNFRETGSKGKWMVWHQRELSFFQTQHTPSANFPSQLLKWSCLRAAEYCINPKVEINPPAQGFEVNPLPVGMFSLSS